MAKLTLQTRLTHMQRIHRFLVAWHCAPADADIDVRIGQTSDGIPSVLISINDDTHPFTADEADIVARSVSDTLTKFGKAALDEGLDNLLLALRSGSDLAREALRKSGADHA